MVFTPSRKAPNTLPSSLPAPVVGHIGRQSATGKLWSTLQEVCDLLQIPADPTVADEICRFQHVQFKAGQRIYTIGQSFENLYIVTAGFLKTVVVDDGGNEQILSFPMKGDLFGVDGIHLTCYASEAVALSDCGLIVVPFKKLTAMGRTHANLETSMYGVMSRELMREHSMVSMLGSLSAEARVARFLVFLSERFADMGYSCKEFNLRMTRQDIGSYLGMTLETVSRTLSAFDNIGLIAVDQRTIVINDLHALKTIRRLPPSHGRAKKGSGRAAMPSL